MVEDTGVQRILAKLSKLDFAKRSVARLSGAPLLPKAPINMMQNDAVLGFLDTPAHGQTLSGVVPLGGWALHRGGDATLIEFSVDDVRVPTDAERVPRPDLTRLYPELMAQQARPGFVAGLNTAQWSDGPHRLTWVVRDPQISHQAAAIDVVFRNGPEYDFYKIAYTQRNQTLRQRKLALMQERLRCHLCHLPMAVQEHQFVCPSGHTYAIAEDKPVMVVGEPAYPIQAELFDSPISNNVYPGDVLRALSDTLDAGGVALDVGSGRRLFGAERLVQLEICTYPFTDIVNQSEDLPFLDNSFDFVFSLAVTEHVARPWVLAAEIQRVTKPGGKIIVDSAFLQPLHGYPSHFFNMTHLALRKLFDAVEIESLEPAMYQHPWFSLSWILDRVLVDLAPEQRALVAGLSVQEFYEEMNKYCRSEPNRLADIRLPKHRIEELAAGFTLIGYKR